MGLVENVRLGPTSGLTWSEQSRLPLTRSGQTRGHALSGCIVEGHASFLDAIMLLPPRTEETRRLVMDHVQQGPFDGQVAVVIDEAQTAKFVHEEADAGPGRADHLRQGLLTNVGEDGLGFFLIVEIR